MWEGKHARKKPEPSSFVSRCNQDIASGLIYSTGFQNPAEMASNGSCQLVATSWGLPALAQEQLLGPSLPLQTWQQESGTVRGEEHNSSGQVTKPQ